MSTAVNLTVAAGAITFGNQWYQTGKADWKVPIATVVLGAAVGGIASLDNKAGIIVSVMILIGAATTRFNGRSFIDTLTSYTQTAVSARKLAAKP